MTVDRLILEANAATGLYSARLISPAEWLARTRPAVLAAINELLLDTVRALLTVEQAVSLDLIPTYHEGGKT